MGLMETEKLVLEKIGERLQHLRKEKGYTSYEQFAFEHDFSRMHYWKIEKGKANITIRTLLKLLEIHGLTIEEFFAINAKPS